jgi:hypothetical protein
MRKIALFLLFLFRTLIVPARDDPKDPDNYRKEMVQEVLEDPEAIGKRVKKALERYFKDPEFFEVLIYPTPKEKVPLGYFSRIDVKFRNAHVKVLRVKEGSIRIYGLKVNLTNLYRDGTLRIREVGDTKFHFSITEEAMNQAIKDKNLPVDGARLRISPGRLAFSASFKTLFIRSHVETKGRLVIEDKTKIHFYPDRLKLNRVPIPGFVKKTLSRKINPILDLDDFEFIKSIDVIELKHGLIELYSE